MNLYVLKFNLMLRKFGIAIHITLCLLVASSCTNDSKPSLGDDSSQEHKSEELAEPKHHHHHGDANAYMNESEFEELVQRFNDPARADWQKPNEVIDLLGPFEGKKVMDIGCGTGYFSFPLVEAGAQVIAADVDSRFLEYVSDKQDSLGIGKTKLETRKLPYDSPKLEAAEVDMVLIVDTYHHIENRKSYFEQVGAGLKEKGRLVVIDFKKEDSPVGPPKEMRLDVKQVKEELNAAGFSQIEINLELLQYQYILIAQK